MAKFLLLVVTTGALILTSTVIRQRVERLYDEAPPRILDGWPRSPRELHPLAECTTGQADPMRPRTWSVVEEAAVYAAVVQELAFNRLTWDGKPVALPRAVIVDPNTVAPWTPPGQLDPWPMNYPCAEMPGLRISTAASFRRVNRAPGTPVFRLLALPVPTIYAAVPRGSNGSPDATPLKNFFESIRGTSGHLRFSHVGFSDALDQALVVIERRETYGYGEGIYYLLERRSRRWHVVTTAVMWIS